MEYEMQLKFLVVLTSISESLKEQVEIMHERTRMLSEVNLTAENSTALYKKQIELLENLQHG